MQGTSRSPHLTEPTTDVEQLPLNPRDTQIRHVIMNCLKDGKQNILLDMANVTTIDSSGIGELVGAYTTVTNRGGKLKLLHLPPKVTDLLQVTQLITVFEVYENEQDAVQSY